MTKINFQNLPNTTTPLNATNLNSIQNIDSTVALNSYLTNSWAKNGYCGASKINSVITVTLSVRYGTAALIGTLPSGYRPSETIIIPTYNGTVGTLATIGTDGKITLLDSNQVGSSVCFSVTYT